MKPFPSTPKELGKIMRELRSSRSLRDLESESHKTKSPFSKSTLSRYEKGELPIRTDPKTALFLDKLYGGNGWLELAILHLWHKEWNPWVTEYPVKTHAFEWPAPYSGLVWVHTRPNQRAVGELYSLILEWGPWIYRGEIILPEKGIYLTTGKAADDNGAITCMVTADLPVYVCHGAGEIENEIHTIDISRRWQRS